MPWQRASLRRPLQARFLSRAHNNPTFPHVVGLALEYLGPILAPTPLLSQEEEETPFPLPAHIIINLAEKQLSLPSK